MQHLGPISCHITKLLNIKYATTTAVNRVQIATCICRDSIICAQEVGRPGPFPGNMGLPGAASVGPGE